MPKIQNDAYFTPNNVVKLGWELIEKHIGLENITEVVESSAGAGAWLRELDVPFLAYDINPQSTNIETANFLDLSLEYKPGRLIGFNPPFGARNNLSRAFYKKAVNVADYIAFIQPISQLDNPVSLYEFDLICSVDLGVQHYTDRDLHCCFNIWKRPEKGLNTKPTFELPQGLEMVKGAYGKKLEDYQEGLKARLGFYGAGWAGKWIPMDKPQLSGEYWFYGEQELIDKIKEIDFTTIVKYGCGTPGIAMWEVKKKIKEEFLNDTNK